MAVSFADKLQIVCYACGVWAPDAFANAMIEELGAKGRQVPEENKKRVRQNFLERRRGWFTGEKLQGRNKELVYSMLQRRAASRSGGSRLGNIGDLLNTRASFPQFIERCDVRYTQIEKLDLISPDVEVDWRNRYYNLHFMQLLGEYEEHSLGQSMLTQMRNTYFYLYRRHSVLSGILREVVHITGKSYANAEGKYYQFSRTGDINIIDINVFYLGFYLLAFGAFKDGARTEILEIKVLVGDAIVKGKINCDQTDFAGLLTGIFDRTDTLLAERILLRRVGGGSLDRTPRRLLPEGQDEEEYYQVVDMVDNSAHGQTLSVRSDRLELLFNRSNASAATRGADRRNFPS